MSCCTVFFALLFGSFAAAAADDDHGGSEKSHSGPSPGHSMHGESFNEGPRQAAYLMPGMGNVHFPISSKNPLAQRFFDQGVSQLHGFWYFEAERSFRQAAALDQEHPMPYWGMARANIENEDRSAGFIEQAMQRITKATDKERRLIEAWNERVKKPKPPESEARESADAKPEEDSKPEDKAKKKEAREEKESRLKKYMSDLDSIAVDYPEDIELKAMIVLQAWQANGEGVPIQSFSAMNAMLEQIFKANSRHPAHHFRIHLWDYKKEELAVQSAAMCGPSAPGIAHMWHMPGHTYSRLKRFKDAAWQQEASARVDHAHMMRDRIMPDEIHNYAHNNEWLIRSLSLIGEPVRAISLAKNMIELPRHPKYNTYENRGSAHYGRERLIQVLTQYEMWDELFRLTDTPYLSEETDVEWNDERTAWRAIAASYLNQSETQQQSRAKLDGALRELEVEEAKQTASLNQLIQDAAPKPADEAAPPAATPPDEPTAPAPVDSGASDSAKATSDSAKETSTPLELYGKSDDPSLPKEIRKEWRLPDGDEAKAWSDERKNVEKELHRIRYRKQQLSYWLAAIDAHRAAANRDFLAALKHSHLARPVVSDWVRVEWLALGGGLADATSMAQKKMNDSPGEFLPLVRAAWLLSLQPESTEQLQELIEKLKPMVASVDPEIALWKRLNSSLAGKSIVVDWTTHEKKSSMEEGERPDLDTLGPYCWSPSPAPLWHAMTADGDVFTSKRMAGKPYVAVLYLGSGCLHCVEQLQAMSPKVEEFRKLGLEIVAISTEDLQQLKAGIASFDKPIEIPLLSNVEQDTFKGFRAYDDFEGQPLHGTFLVDSQGRILWQDIGYEPFMEVDFLLGESKRLLELSGPSR